MKLIIDLTRAFAGTEADLVTRLCADHVHTGPAVVVGLAEQRSEVASVEVPFDYAVVGSAYEPEVLTFLGAKIADLLRTDPDEEVRLYSFHPGTRETAKYLGELAGRVQVATPVSKTGTLSPGAWPDELMPIHEAVRVLERVLREANARVDPVRKTDIRARLAVADRRFDKTRSPAAQTPALITKLLAAAEKRGLIRMEGKEPRVMVWLIAPNRPAPPSALPAVTISAQARDTFAPGTRSEVFQFVLRQKNMGHFVVWQDMIRNVAEIMSAEAEREGLLVGDVVRRAVVATCERAPQMFRRKKSADLPKERYPWRDLEGCFIDLLSRAGFVADAAGERMTSGPVWQLKRGTLLPLTENWAEALDAQMILEVIRTCGDVQWSDGRELAGAIYLEREQEWVDRIDRVIELLFDSGAVDMDPQTGYLFVR